MATQTRAPTGDHGTQVSGTWSGSAGTRYTLVDDYPDTGGTDILTHGTATAGHIIFTFSAFTVPAGATAISVQVLYYDRKNASQACDIAAQLLIGSTPTVHNATSHNPTNGSIVQRTDDFTINPKSGAAWTVNDVNGVGANGLVGFGWVSTDANPAIDLTSIQLQVTYTFVAARAQIGWLALEVPMPASWRRAQISWLALEVPPTPTPVPVNFASLANGAVIVNLKYQGSSNRITHIIATNTLGRDAMFKIMLEASEQEITIPNGASGTEIELPTPIQARDGIRCQLRAT